MTTPKYCYEDFAISIYVYGAFPIRQIVLVCERISQIVDFSQDMRALPEARTVTKPVGEIRGGLHE